LSWQQTNTQDYVGAGGSAVSSIMINTLNIMDHTAPTQSLIKTYMLSSVRSRTSEEEDDEERDDDDDDDDGDYDGDYDGDDGDEGPLKASSANKVSFFCLFI